MKKISLLIIALTFFGSLSAQVNFSRLNSEFDSLKRTTIYGHNQKAGKYYDIRGFKMYCETYGTGKPLLLIHGNGASIADFVKQIPFFSKNYKVIAVDSRAHGKSIDKSDSLSYGMMADDFAALLTAMHLDSVYVLGWSDGGINGLLLAIRHPEKVRKLAITGANLQPDSSAISPKEYLSTYQTYDMLRKKFLENKPKSPLDSTVFKYMKLLIEQPHIPLSDLHKISVPALVIGGDHDIILPAHTLMIFQNIPKSFLWILPDSGHATLVYYADEFNRKVNEFFSGHTSTH